MAPAKGTSLSLRPFPVADTKPQSLADFIARINTQDGGFRELAESKLREEVQQKNAPPKEDVEMSDDEDDEEDGIEDGADTRAQELIQARIEVLQNIDVAGNTAMLTLDSLSLLLSKQNPTQAGITLSKQLRDMTGIGTLGADRLEDGNITVEKEKDQEEIAQGWTIMEIDKTRDSATAAVDFLEKEVEMEGNYWEEVIGVRNSGWSVCKVPQDKRVLGVRFGFSEATPEFKNNGLAPLRRTERGTVQLDRDQLGNVSERLVVTYETNGKVVGRSALPAHVDNNAPLEAQVLDARNTLFAQELWHELSREARTLAAYYVRLQDNRLTFHVGDDTSIIVELVTLGSTPSSDESLPENSITESISLALHVLLSYAHRNNELIRMRPVPPHVSRARGGQHTYALLRPILAHISHLQNVRTCTRYIGTLVQALKKAGLPASFTLLTPGPWTQSPDTPGPNEPSNAQHLIRNLTQSIDFHIELAIIPETAFTIRGRTFLYPFMGTYYHILPPPDSPLEVICTPYKEGYPDFKALTDYVRAATAKLLVYHYLSKLPSRSWTRNVKGTSIHNLEGEDCDLQFLIVEKDAQPSLDVTYVKIIGGKRRTREWVWRDVGNSEMGTLNSLVDSFVRKVISI